MHDEGTTCVLVLYKVYINLKSTRYHTLAGIAASTCTHTPHTPRIKDKKTPTYHQEEGQSSPAHQP